MSISLELSPLQLAVEYTRTDMFGTGPLVGVDERSHMPDPIVSCGWLSEALGDVTVVDVRREWHYEDSPHVPGAVNVPFEEFRDPTDETEGKLSTAASFAELLGAVGVESDDRIVAYDDDCGVYASRFLVTAEVFGHDVDRLHLLDGDIHAWERDHAVTTAEPTVEPSDYACARTGDGPLVDAATLEDALDGDAVVVDTRDPIEYDTVHLPGAVNVQWRDLVDDESRTIRPQDELRDVLAGVGVTMDRPVRLYCNTARRLSFLYVILRHLGHDDVAFYEGGIDTWADYGGPVESSS